MPTTATKRLSQRRPARRRRDLTSDAPAVAPVWGVLRKPMHRSIPREEVQRIHYGRTVDLIRIDNAIRNANKGYMRHLADIALETIRLDGHASALWQKRLNRLAALDWDVIPAKGEGIDDQRAADYAGEVRQQLESIPNFRQCLMDLNQAVYHGRAASEIEWVHQRGRWRVANLHWIHARRLSFGPQRDLRIIDLNREVGNFEDEGFALEHVPYKFIAYKPRMFGDYPEREGLAPRTIFWSFFSRFGVRERLHLIEVFGKPWRIAMPKWDPKNPSALDPALVDEAFDALNSLGAHSTAAMPVNMEVMIAQPTKGAGDAFVETIDHAEKIQSKLYLGATGTTDAISTGLGSNVGSVHLSEEDLIIASDAWRLSEVVEDQLGDSIIVVNHGVDAIDHAPKFVIKTEPPKDLKAEAELIKAILDIGVDMSLAEVRERLGIREIKDDEAIVRRIQRNINGNIPLHLPLPEVLYPDGTRERQVADLPKTPGAVAPPPPKEALDPAAAALLPKQGEPPALPAPAGDDDIELEDAGPTSAEKLAAKMTENAIERCPHGKPNRCRICGIEREWDFDELDPDGDGTPNWKVLWKPIVAPPAPAVPTLRAKRHLAEPRLAQGDGGMHQHYIDRSGEHELLVNGGEHTHAFLVDGHLLFTELDGPHQHSGDESWENAGVHYHRLAIPGGGLLDTEIGGSHYHGKGVSVTGVDGAHTHALKLTDGRVVQSLTAEQLADILAADQAAE